MLSSVVAPTLLAMPAGPKIHQKINEELVPKMSGTEMALRWQNAGHQNISQAAGLQRQLLLEAGGGQPLAQQHQWLELGGVSPPRCRSYIFPPNSRSTAP